jgi:hypothetical protein
MIHMESLSCHEVFFDAGVCPDGNGCLVVGHLASGTIFPDEGAEG